jgi:GT2 family glycosyltransferase
MRTASGHIAIAFEHAAAAMSERRYEEAAATWRQLMAEPELDERLLRIVREALTSSQRAQGRTPDEDLWPERLMAVDHAEQYPDRLAIVDRPEGSRLADPRVCTVLIEAGPASMDAFRSTVRSLEAQRDVDVRLVVEVAGPSEVEAIGRAIGDSHIAEVAVIVADEMLPSLESARRAGSGDAVLLLEVGTLLRPDALAVMCAELADDPALLFVYADEDGLDADGLRQDPMLKPSWDPDLLLVQPYLGSAVVFHPQAVAEAGGVPALRLQPLTPEHQLLFTVWSLAIRVAYGASGAAADGRPARVRHVPELLLHRPRSGARDDWMEGPMWTAETVAAQDLVRGCLSDTGVDRIVETAPWGMPLRVGPSMPARTVRVSVIVPTRDRPDLLETCAAGVLRNTSRSMRSADGHRLDVELIIVDNDTVDPSALALIERLGEEERVRVVPGPGEFNFSRLVNLGVAAATGEVCVLLNNDVTPTHDDWIEELVRHALRPEVGIVGALLLHADDRVQHAGVIVGVNGTAEHAFREWPAGSAGYLALLRSTRRVSAVTAACMAVRREVYLELGGLDEVELPVELSDIDLCLRAEESGLAVVWSPHARLHHVEGGTRARPGRDHSTVDADLRMRSVESQRSRFQRRWQHRLRLDPHYHPALADSGATYLLRPVA